MTSRPLYDDIDTGLYYNRFRYYDPGIGQYIQQDPIGLAGGNPTLYGYVADTNAWIDPFGLSRCAPPRSRALSGPKLPQSVAETFKNATYRNRRLTKSEIFYKYHGADNRTGRKFSWLTKSKYSSEGVLRSDLAIRRDWGVKITKVSEFNVPKGTWVSEGVAASQGVGYPGGGYQAVITNLPRSWVTKTKGVPWL